MKNQVFLRINITNHDIAIMISQKIIPQYSTVSIFSYTCNKYNMRTNEWVLKKTHRFSLYVKLEVSKSKPAVLLMNPGDFGVVRRGTHDASVSPVIWYVSTFLHRKNLHFIRHMSRLTSVHVNNSPNLEAWRPRTKDMPARCGGTQPNEDDAEQIFPQVDKSWHRHRCIWQIPCFCACLNVSQMVVNSEAWRGASLCVEAIGEEH